MSWQSQLEGDSLSWLLEPDTPGVRYLALRDLLDRPEDDPELRAARDLAPTPKAPSRPSWRRWTRQGYWVEPGPGYNPKYRSTVWSVIMLAQLGASAALDERIARACAYLLDHALTPGGQFTASGAPSGTADCLQGNLCWALLELGCDDPRLERGLRVDGAQRHRRGHCAQRRTATRRCATTPASAGRCLPAARTTSCPAPGARSRSCWPSARWPAERRTPADRAGHRAGRGLPLQRRPGHGGYPSGYTTNPAATGGSSASRCSTSPTCCRSSRRWWGWATAVTRAWRTPWPLIRDKQDAQGRWPLEYDYAGKTWVDFGPKKQPNKWVTLRALRVLKAVT